MSFNKLFGAFSFWKVRMLFEILALQGLICEVHEIHDSIKLLERKLRCAEHAINRLEKAKDTLQKDIKVKEHSLEVDSRDCVGMRKNMALDPKVGPIFNMPLYNSC